jgi:hypothetical protein
MSKTKGIKKPKSCQDLLTDGIDFPEAAGNAADNTVAMQQPDNKQKHCTVICAPP